MPWKPNQKGAEFKTVDREHRLICTCGSACNMVTGQEIYPHRQDLWSKKFYLCPECGAYVGVHVNGTPFGVPADERTRKARSEAHKAFDPLWQSGRMTRTTAYRKLRAATGVCHISWEDHRGCAVVVEWASKQKTPQ